ncbi:hypothetical protein SGRIM128S_08647 [Streptomyces griseomycini]
MTRRPPRIQRAASSTPSDSPPVITVRTVAARSSGTVARTGGGSSTWVAAFSVSRAAISSPGSRLSAGPSTRVAPETSAWTTSATAASKLSDIICRTRLEVSMARFRMWPVSIELSPWWETATPLGRPVEPEVWMTYAVCAGWTGAARSASVRSVPGRSARRSRTPSVSRSTTRAAASAPRPAIAASLPRESVTTRTGAASSSMWAMRSAGCAGSTGSQAAPALATAAIATTHAVLRGTSRATSRSGPAPSAASSRASRLARVFSSR